MANPYPKKAWFPAGADPRATGLLLGSPKAVPTKWMDYHDLLADRVELMLETTLPEDFREAVDDL